MASTKNNTVTFKDDSYVGGFVSELAQHREGESYTDIILQAKTAQIPCHRVIISSSSPYLKEKVKNLHDDGTTPLVLEFNILEPEALAVAVDYIYGKRVNISTGNVQAVCTASNLFELKGLKQFCDKFLAAHVGPSNCLGLLMFSKETELPLTLRSSKKCMLGYLVKIVQVAEELEYKTLNESSLLEYIASDDIQVENEDPVFELVVKWIQADEEVRKPSAEKVMSYIRFQFCTTEFLCDVVEQSPYMATEKNQKLLQDAKTYLILPNRRDKCKVRPRKQTRQLLVLGGCGQDDVINKDCYNYDEGSRKWEHLMRLPAEDLYYIRVCSIGNKIILTGGATSINIQGAETQVSNKAWMYDLWQKKWMPLPPMIDGRAAHATASIDDNVYVFGGQIRDTSMHRTTSVEKLNLKSNQWVKAAPMKTALSRHTAVEAGNNIFIMGGGTKYLSSQIVQMYDTISDKWTEKAEMPKPCERGSAVFVNGNIYAIGSNTSEFMMYNIKQNVWSELAEPKMKNTESYLAAWKGRILLGGGRVDMTSKSQQEQMEEYSAELDRWTSFKPPLPKKLYGHRFLVAPFLPAL